MTIHPIDEPAILTAIHDELTTAATNQRHLLADTILTDGETCLVNTRITTLDAYAHQATTSTLADLLADAGHTARTGNMPQRQVAHTIIANAITTHLTTRPDTHWNTAILTAYTQAILNHPNMADTYTRHLAASPDIDRRAIAAAANTILYLTH